MQAISFPREDPDLGPRIRAVRIQGDNPRPANAPDDPLFTNGQQPYLTQIGAPTAWDRQIGSRQVIVAVLDTGITLTHPELFRNLFFNAGEIPASVPILDVDGNGIDFVDLNAPQNADAVADTNGNGYIDGQDVLASINLDGMGKNQGGLSNGVDEDAVSGERTNIVDDLVGARIGFFSVTASSGGTPIRDNQVQDDQQPPGNPTNRHGTAVAGLIGAEGNNAATSPVQVGPNGGGLLTGVSWQVRILPIKVADSTGAAENITILTDALRYARRMGARVANMSLALAVTLPPEVVGSEKARFEEAYNDGLNGGGETMLNVIAAGNQKVDCSKFEVVCGPAEFGLRRTIIVTSADGADNFAATIQPAGGSNFGEDTIDIAAPGTQIVMLDALNGGTQTLDGTSFSAPLVSGSAALLLAQSPELFSNDIIMLRSFLLGRADVLSSLDGRVKERRRLNVGKAIQDVP